MQLYQPTITGSLSVSGSIELSGSLTLAGGGTISGTASIATNAITASSADNFLVRNTLTAQTLVVQTITSSVDFVTGSTRFGSIAANTHTFTGSMSVSGSMVAISSISTYSGFNVFQNSSEVTPAQIVLADTSNSRQLLIGYNSGSNYGSIQAIHQGVGYKNLSLNANGGNVGIGTTTPGSKLTISGDLNVQAGTLSAFGFGLQQNSTFAFSGTAYRTAIFAYNTGDGNGIQLGYDATAGTGIIAASTNGSGAATAFWTYNGSWAERMRITKDGNVGIGIASPTASLTVVNSVAGIPSIPSLGSVNVYTTAYFTNANPSYGLLMGSLNNGNSWMQVGRVDGSATAYDLQLQPNGGSVITGGAIVSVTGQFGSQKTVQINALNTSYLVLSGAPSGIFSARDNTNGGSGLWLLDPNGNGGTATLVAQNWINGAYTVFYSGGNTYVQKTSGNVPVIFHYAIYGN